MHSPCYMALRCVCVSFTAVCWLPQLLCVGFHSCVCSLPQLCVRFHSCACSLPQLLCVGFHSCVLASTVVCVGFHSCVCWLPQLCVLASTVDVDFWLIYAVFRTPKIYIKDCLKVCLKGPPSAGFTTQRLVINVFQRITY